jgi:hypothetical protein
MNQRSRMRQRAKTGLTNVIDPSASERLGSNIELTIDALVLVGVPAAQRFQIANAVQDQLTARLTREGLPPSLLKANFTAGAALDGGTIRLAPNPRSETVGGEVARAIYQGMARGQVTQHKGS